MAACGGIVPSGETQQRGCESATGKEEAANLGGDTLHSVVRFRGIPVLRFCCDPKGILSPGCPFLLSTITCANLHFFVNETPSRQNGLPRTFSEFCHHATVSKKDIGGFYRILTPILDPQGICARPVLAENFMVSVSSMHLQDAMIRIHLLILFLAETLV